MRVCQWILSVDRTSESFFSQFSLKRGGKYVAIKFGVCAVFHKIWCTVQL